MKAEFFVKFENSILYPGGRTPEEAEEMRVEITSLFTFLSLYSQTCIISVNAKEHLKVGAHVWLSGLKYFVYGFGGNHMWITQKNIDRRIILITWELK